MASDRRIVVLGAGVIGLTTAMLLAEAGYRVTVISKHVPEDSSIEYTSPWAGAHWRTHATANEPEQCDWDVQTYEYWLDLMRKEEEGRKNREIGGNEQQSETLKSGIKMYDQFHYWDDGAALTAEELWWAPYVRGFATIEPIRTHPSATQGKAQPAAARCRAMAINAPQHLFYLQQRVRAHGGMIVKSTLPTGGGLTEAVAAAEDIARANGRGRVDCFVNATGLGARALCSDDAMYPVRGQTVLVKGEAHAIRIRQGEGFQAYCIPRPGSGTTILGGTKEVGVWSETVDEMTTRKILERARDLAPELRTGRDGQFEVVSVQCGLRPARHGGPRTEKEVLRDGRTKVVHAYGHAGAGYQNSIGAARQVVRLVDEFVETDTKETRGARL